MRPVIAVAALALSLAAAEAALACSCAPYRSAAEQLAATDLVFKGKVLADRPEAPGTAVARFRVYNVIKGHVGLAVQVRHTLDSASCGVRFKPGQTVLVLAHRGADGFWRTGLCSAAWFPEAEYRAAARGEPVPVRGPAY